jgi:hypothetical protein
MLIIKKKEKKKEDYLPKEYFYNSILNGLGFQTVKNFAIHNIHFIFIALNNKE